MLVGFGFLISDLIALVELVGTVIDALRSRGNARAEYRELVAQLLSLETALIQVRGVEAEEAMYEEVVALRQAIASCRRTIDAFWEKAKKYQPSLGSGEKGKWGVRDGWMKVKWAVYKKEDITRFRGYLSAHTQSIQLLLSVWTIRIAGGRDAMVM
ncbi:hypothetical protein LCER1_G009465 [Lachnellula cervina]|uniref:Azaphilone pigments biosynthesis cluster protein L N-terminal domain-containing protein n=1 Tax=Lachnellula cervina TaxID=1316786 RepID=A0A7D8UIS8_9HELO|nr:hypothetical protein LCER1_G009465 [Lachnellula cervina]